MKEEGKKGAWFHGIECQNTLSNFQKQSIQLLRGLGLEELMIDGCWKQGRFKNNILKKV